MSKYASLEYSTHPWELTCLIPIELIGHAADLVAGLGMSSFEGELHIHADPDPIPDHLAEYWPRVDNLADFTCLFHQFIHVGDDFSQANMGQPLNAELLDLEQYHTNGNITEREPTEIVPTGLTEYGQATHLHLHEVGQGGGLRTLVVPVGEGPGFDRFTLPGSAQPEKTLRFWLELIKQS